MNEFVLYVYQPLGFLVQMFPPAWMLLYVFRGQYRYSFRWTRLILTCLLLFLTLLFTLSTLFSYFSGSDQLYLTANLIFGLCLLSCFIVFSALTTAEMKKKLFFFFLVLNYACLVLAVENAIQEIFFQGAKRIEQLPYFLSDVVIFIGLTSILSPLFYGVVCKKYLQRLWNLQGKGWSLLLAAQSVYFSLACVVVVFSGILIDTKIAYILLGFLFFTELVMYVIALRLLELSEEKHDAELAGERSRQNMRLHEQQYESLKESIELTRKQRHDMEHHFALLYVMSQKEEDLPKLRAYLEEYLSENTVKNVRFCDNYTVNAFLNHYAQLCGEKQIALQARLDLPEELWVKDIHLSILFGNALKNALEACTQCREQGMDAVIAVQAAVIQHALVLRVENTIAREADRDEGGWLSSKRKGYGTGLSIIEDVAELYQGTVNIEQKNNRFILKAILYGN